MIENKGGIMPPLSVTPNFKQKKGKIMKRAISVLTVLALFISMLTVFPTAASLTEINGVYQISTKEQLLLFANLVNGVGDYEGASDPDASAVLTADIVYNVGVIDVEGNLNQASGIITAWQPIGYSYDGVTVSYSGTFDGAGHSISGLYTCTTDVPCIGLFGITSSDAVIKDLSVIGSYFEAPDMVGGIVGKNSGTVIGCTTKNTVVGIDAVNGIGGAVGYNLGTVADCVNNGGIGTFDGKAGGIIGTSTSSVAYCQNNGNVTSVLGSVGGICASAPGAEKCINTADVTGVYATGGIIGTMSGNITNCLNYGTVFTDTSDSGYYGVGLLVGMMKDGDVKNSCYRSLDLPAIGCDGNFDAVKSYGAQHVSSADLLSGSVSWKLGDGVGQTLDGTSYPTLGGDRVYYVRLSVSGAGEVSGNYGAVFANSSLTASATDDAYFFSGWYTWNGCVSTDAELTLTKDLPGLEAVFSLKGDADRNGVINAKDVILYRMYIGGQTSFGNVADLDGDGVIGTSDVKILTENIQAQN